MVQIVISSAGAGGLAEWVLMELQGEIEARYSTGLAGNLLGDLHYTTELHQAHWLQIQHLSLLVLVIQAWLLFQEG
uniref:Chromosome transmission fidelity factor 8 n=1 Tax=Panthera tigris altaica TaxID=74533 RepID=A0A8C9JQ10_PANTA